MVTTTIPEQVAHAQALAERFHVFPLDHPSHERCQGQTKRCMDKRRVGEDCTGDRGKHPACKWSEYGTQDLERLAQSHYFGSALRNFAIDCGKSGIVVIDEDQLGEMDRYCADHGVDVPDTFTSRTAKGRHFYFWQPTDGDPIGNAEGAVKGYKMNVRGSGGYVVAPGSIHESGANYTAIDPDVEVLPCPPWLAVALRSRPKTTTTSATGVETYNGTTDHWWREGPIEEGDRHGALVAAAGWCLAEGLRESEARPIVRDVLARCEGGKYTEADAMAKLADVYGRYPAGDALARRDGGLGFDPSALDVEDGPTLWAGRFTSGGDAILDIPDGTPAVWGRGAEVLWAKGEPMMLAAPPGVGKTTLIQQVTLGLVGLRSEVIGYPVDDSGGKVLFLAMDRPRQILRSFNRMVTEVDREVLNERLLIWPGPPPADFASDPTILTQMARAAGADVVIVDSLKDAAVKLTDDETGGKVNRAIQLAIADGVEVAIPHHQRKGQGGEKPKRLEDVYGSTWLTAGMGSVVLLWGAAGDPIVELHHLKQPAEEVGPLKLMHDAGAGVTTVYRGFDLDQYLANNADRGVTTRDVAVAMLEKTQPTDSEREKARRKLESAVRSGRAFRKEGVAGGDGGARGARYYPAVMGS